MINNSKATAAVLSPGSWLLAVSPSVPPYTLEEHLHLIDALGQKISNYVQSMCQVGALANASLEVKARAVTAFYQQMTIAEKQLGRIHDKLQLE